MDYEVSLSADGRYLLTRVRVPMTRELMFEINQELRCRAAPQGIEWFLYDLRGCANVDSVLNNYLIAYDDADSVQFTRRERFAVLHLPDDTSHDFIETVAMNAGYNLKLFTDEQQAVDWLIS